MDETWARRSRPRFIHHSPTTVLFFLFLFSLLYRFTPFWKFPAFRCMIVELFRFQTGKEFPNGRKARSLRSISYL